MESELIIGCVEDDHETFIVKEEPTDLLFEEEECNHNVSTDYNTCSLCHGLNSYDSFTGWIEQADDELNEPQSSTSQAARTTFFNQQIKLSANAKLKPKSSAPHQCCFFCDSCCSKIDHLLNIYNQLISLQKEFETLKHKLIADYVQGLGRNVDKLDDPTVLTQSSSEDEAFGVVGTEVGNNKSRGNGCAENEKAENVDDDDGGSVVLGSYEISSESMCDDKEYYDKSTTLDMEKLTSCSVKVERLNLKILQPTDKLQNGQHQLKTTMYACTTCHKTFSSSFNLNRHLVVHTAKCAHICQYCKRGFNASYHLTRHLALVHQGGKVQVCRFCPKKRFYSTDELAAHTKSCIRHQNANASTIDANSVPPTIADSTTTPPPAATTSTTKPKQCHICFKSYTNQISLNVHLRTHSGSRPYKCPTCSRGFKKSDHLKNHLVVHTRTKDHICEFCSKGFSRRDFLRWHLDHIHHGLKRQNYACPNCPRRKFLSAAELSNHTETCTASNKADKCKVAPKIKYLRPSEVKTPTVCHLCGKTYTTRKGLRRHLVVVHKFCRKPLQCTQCPLEFPTPVQLRNHTARVHGVEVGAVEEEQVKKCPDCELTFSKTVLLQVHCRKACHGEARNNQCEFCGQCFTSPYSLRCHISNVHEGLKRFQCLQCSRTFATKSHLNLHTTEHTGVGLFKCSYCQEASFNEVSMLRKHLVGSHPEEYCTKSNKIFVCETCWKNFELQAQLDEHQSSTHYICQVCKKVFKTPKGLEKHSFIHTGERPFVCIFCEKGFHQKSTMVEHERLHYGDRRFKCTQCTSQFLRKYQLETHTQKFHS